jgi:hypothetical protein
MKGDISAVLDGKGGGGVGDSFLDDKNGRASSCIMFLLSPEKYISSLCVK